MSVYRAPSPGCSCQPTAVISSPVSPCFLLLLSRPLVSTNVLQPRFVVRISQCASEEEGRQRGSQVAPLFRIVCVWSGCLGVGLRRAGRRRDVAREGWGALELAVYQRVAIAFGCPVVAFSNERKRFRNPSRQDPTCIALYTGRRQKGGRAASLWVPCGIRCRGLVSVGIEQASR